MGSVEDVGSGLRSDAQHKVQTRSNVSVVGCVGIIALMVLAGITLLVVGILGATNAFTMSPAACRALIGIGSALIIGSVAGVCQGLCR